MTEGRSDGDPYVYPGTDILRNHFDIRDPTDLELTEHEFTRQRMSEPLPSLALTPDGYRAIHRHIFQDLYAWAGELRTVNIARGNSFFATVENLASELARCFDAMRADERLLSSEVDTFTEAAAEHVNELNARHPFREGNGRTQRALLQLLAERAGFELRQDRIDPSRWNSASRIGFHAVDYKPMVRIIRGALEPISSEQPTDDADRNGRP